MRFGFRASDLDPIAFSDEQNRNSFPMRKKSDSLCVHRFEQTPRPTAVVVVWRREETRWAHCAARRIPASEPTLTALGLAAKRPAECARVNLSWHSVPVFTMCLTAAAAVVYY